jgi:hypothetical protein
MRVVVGWPAASRRALQVCVQTLDDPSNVNIETPMLKLSIGCAAMTLASASVAATPTRRSRSA